MIDLAALKAFVTIVDTGSFSAAAEQLHLTQPAISKRIKVLEMQLNSELFIRIPKQLLLSEAGKTLLPRARAIITDVNRAQQALQDLNGVVSGDLHIAASHHIGLHYLPQVLKDFCLSFEMVDMDLQFAESESAYQKLLTRQAELAIVTLPEVLDSHLTAHLQWPDPLVLFCGKEHPLAFEKQLTLKDIAPFKAILPSKRTFTYKKVEQSFRHRGLNLNATLPTNDLEIIKMMVAVGLGWSALPEKMINDDLVVMQIDEPLPSRSMGVLSYGDSSLSKAASAFLKIVEKHWPNSLKSHQ